MNCHINQPIQSADWNGLRVWVIGASTGIGESLALKLAALGSDVVLSARRRAPLEAVATACRARHPEGTFLILPFDICDTSATEQAVSAVKATLGSVDIVIFNAGTYEATRIDTLTPDNAERSLSINLLAPIKATGIIFPLLVAEPIASKPRGFAYVASVAGYRGLPRALTYGPGKAGLISFAESLWVDLQGMGLNTWVINPGFVRTRLTAQNDFAMPAIIEPDEAATAIIKGFSRGAFEIHFPKRFTWFMKLMRILPTSLYLKMVRRLVPPPVFDKSSFKGVTRACS